MAILMHIKPQINRLLRGIQNSVNCFQPLTILAKLSISDIWQGSESASELLLIEYFLTNFFCFHDSVYLDDTCIFIKHRRWSSQIFALHKKYSFPLEISSVNVIKYRSSLRIWSHFLKKSLMEKFIFCAVSYFLPGMQSFLMDPKVSKILMRNLY